MRSQCTLTYEKQSKIQKEADHIYQKLQDTIVHRFSGDCIDRLNLHPCARREECGEKVLNQHSEYESGVPTEAAIREVVTARGPRPVDIEGSCGRLSYTQGVGELLGERGLGNLTARVCVAVSAPRRLRLRGFLSFGE